MRFNTWTDLVYRFVKCSWTWGEFTHHYRKNYNIFEYDKTTIQNSTKCQNCLNSINL